MQIFNPDSKFSQFIYSVMDYVKLGLVFLLFSIPGFTAGAAAAAVMTVGMRIERKEAPTIFRPFWQAFKENFKKGMLASLVLLLPLLLLLLYLFLGLSGGLADQPLMRGLCWVAAAVIGVFNSYLWPLLAWYENSLGNSLKNAVLLPLSNPLIALAVTALNLLPVYLLLRHTYVFLRISFLWLVAGFALTAFVNTQLLRLQFRHVTREDV